MSQIKELEKQIVAKRAELNELETGLEKIKTCHHNWIEVETGEGEYDSQCQNCLLLKSELNG